MFNILFIGNSYTYYNDMPSEIFLNMTESIGISLKVTSITKGGESLLGHATEGGEKYDEIESAFATKKFDFVILQDQSDTPAVNREKYLAGLDHFVNKAKENGAKAYIYGTWPKKEGHKNLEKYGITKAEMAELLNSSFAYAAKKYDISAAYVGPVFTAIEEANDLPDPYNADLSHPSYTGSFAAALCLLKTIFGTEPTAVSFCGKLTDEEARKIKLLVNNPNGYRSK